MSATTVPPPISVRLSRWALTLGLVALAAWSGVRLARAVRPANEQPAPSTQPDNAGLVVDAAQLNFGEVWEDSRFRWTLAVRNEGGQDAEIIDFANSCSCSHVDPRSLTIPAGGQASLRITLDLTTKKPGEPHAAVRPFGVLVRPVIRGADRLSLRGWELSGRVRVALQLKPEVLDFGYPSERGQPLPAKTVRVIASTALEGLEATSDTPDFSVTVKGDTRSSEFDLSVRPRAGLGVGAYQATVSLVPRLKGGRPLPAQRLPVALDVQPDLQVVPPQVLLGARPVGETVEETVTLRSLTGQKVEVLAATVKGAGLAARREGLSCAVTQRIASAGEQSGAVVFRVRGEDGRTRDLTVEVSYRGLVEVK